MSDLGITTIEAEEKLREFGLNDVVENKAGIFKKFLAPLVSPISIMLLGAAFLSLFNGKKFDFWFILSLYGVNYFVQKWQEFKADKAIKQLQDKLSFDCLALRDGQWNFINAKYLVPGDRIKIGLGNVIPADATVLSSLNLSVNESALTGESLPKEKRSGDKIYSGSFVVSGNLEAEITSTGKNTLFGKTIFSIEQSGKKSSLERDILSITRFLMVVSVIAVLILTVFFFLKGAAISDLLTLDLSLIIAGIPIALPAVMAIILSIGASRLSKHMVVVRRLSALEDLANVDLLLTDKTGTLTKNEIQVVNIISYDRELSTNDIIEMAGFCISKETPSAIDLAISAKLDKTVHKLEKTEVLKFTPYNSERKRTTVLIRREDKKFLLSLGAPHTIKRFDGFGSKEMDKKFEDDITHAAENGYRAMALAIKKGDGEEKNMRIAGLLLLADPLDEGAKDTIYFMRKNGIDIKILTGDDRVITKRVIEELGLEGDVVSAEKAEEFYSRGKDALIKDFSGIAAFAEVLPKDKYEITKLCQINHTVAVTGDGVNDLPALKASSVGVAVKGAVSALKSVADIILLGQGISVIRDAILESRKIFVRLYNYSVYRISESFRLIITILILGVWYGLYPLVPIQLILLAFLNDIPIISLAVDRVKITSEPSKINIKNRFTLSLLFGTVGILNSIFLFLIMVKLLNLPLPIVQTAFFLKLTVSGHALIFVAHTKERWYKFLPSKEVIIATLITQFAATVFTVTGFLMPAKISIFAAILVWVWALIWMQAGELAKAIYLKLANQN